MTTKLKKDSGARDPFRPKFVIDDVARITMDNKNYNYKLVIYNYPKKPNNVPEHEAMGYEIVYSTEHLEDDRKFSPDNDKEEALRPKPVTKRTTDGYEQVLMRIRKDRVEKNDKERLKLEQQKLLKSMKGKVTKQHGQVNMDGGEINFNETNGDTK